MKAARDLVSRVVGPFDRHCSGAGFQSADCYVTAPLIGLGVVPLRCSHPGSDLLDRIIAFDRAESSFANLTQTNLVAVSSFNGPRGLLWGFDLLPQPLQRHPSVDPLPFPEVFSLEPLLAATRALFGTVQEKRFPIQPGQHVLSAYKTFYQQGPCRLYGAMAVAIPENRHENADLFMEDLGLLEDVSSLCGQESAVLERLIDAVQRIGDNLGVRYETILVGFRTCPVPEGEMGCVLTAAPYIHLARHAVPFPPEMLLTLSLQEWEATAAPYFLTPASCPRSLPRSTISASCSL